jgi:enamine deaminase RidA (YjgF/YER057c/UK114 family)
MLISKQLNDNISYSSFIVDGGAEEHFIVLQANKELNFTRALSDLHDRYKECLIALGLSIATQVFTRVYLSDIANQRTPLLVSKLHQFYGEGAFSIIQQCPLNGSSFSLLCYHIKPIDQNLNREHIMLDAEGWRNALSIKGNNYQLLFSGNFSGQGAFDSSVQTTDLFNTYGDLLKTQKMTLLDNVVRTWIYVRDIDNHYMGMVKARVDHFNEHGLDQTTRYIASTGIEAQLGLTDSLVAMDAVSVSNLEPSQIIRMEALDHISPTHRYGVTFERGARVDFGDRSHFYISGTASIDSMGNVLHPGDVTKQTLRTLENITALLHSQGANLSDMAYFIVYLRNLTTAVEVKRILAQAISKEIPMIFVEGTVCRPGWLVEIEGIGVKEAKQPYPNFL